MPAARRIRSGWQLLCSSSLITDLSHSHVTSIPPGIAATLLLIAHAIGQLTFYLYVYTGSAYDYTCTALPMQFRDAPLLAQLPRPATCTGILVARALVVLRLILLALRRPLGDAAAKVFRIARAAHLAHHRFGEGKSRGCHVDCSPRTPSLR